MKKLTMASLALCMVSLLGCSSNDEEEELVLPEIVNQFEADVIWQEGIGDGVEHFFSRLTPTYHQQTVFVAERYGRVAALDLSSGETKWEINTQENPAFWPWEDDDSAKLSGGILHAYSKLYIGSEHGEIIALDRETGELIWRKAVPGEVLSTPAAGDGLIYVNLGSGTLLALHPDTGEERWRYDQEVPALTLRGLSAPTSANGGVLVGEANGKLSVLIAENGFTAWSSDVALAKGASEFERLVDVDTQPVVSGAYVYSIAYNGKLVAVDVRNGNVVWDREYSSYRNLALNLNTIYLVDSDGVLYALDKDTGTERWTQSGLRGWYLTAPAVAGDYLVVGDQEGNLHWLDKESGQLVSRTELDSSGFFVAPLIVEDKVVVYTRDGEVSTLAVPQ